MKKIANLQDLFLLSARRNRTSVTVFLVNGFQMRGVITGFDSFVVILESDGKQQMLYTRSQRSCPSRSSTSKARRKVRSKHA